MNQEISAFPTIFNSIADGIIALDAQWRFIYLNPAAELLLGSNPGELVGKNSRETFSKFNEPKIQAECQRAFATQGPVQLELYHPSPCNIWLEYRIYPSQEGLLIFLREIKHRKSTESLSHDSPQNRLERALRLSNERLRQRDITNRKRVDEELKRSQEELEFRVQARTAGLEAANASLRALGDNLPEVAIYQFISTCEGEGRYTYLSKGFERITGISVEAALHHGDFHFAIHPDDLPRVQHAISESINTLQIYDVEGRVMLPRNQEKWIRWRATPRILETGEILCEGIMTDVTKRRTAEAALKDAHQALLSIKECGEAIARATNETELLHNVCQTILKMDDTVLAWIGFPMDDPEKSIRVMAQAGKDPGYVDLLQLSWADIPQGRGPAGTAIRRHEAVFFNDLQTAPGFDLWKEAARERGYASVIALPLLVENRCLGVMGIYSSKQAAFHKEKVELLKQLAADISHGLLGLRTRVEREQLEKELLRISEREKQHIAQELHDGLCQHLAGSSLMASLLQRRLEQAGSSEAEYAKEICDLLSTGLAEARNLSHGLHPIKAEGEGLMEALAQLAQTSTRLFHTNCSFLHDDGVSVNGQAVTHLFRIAQEALRNAIKHGRPTQVALSLNKLPDALLLCIEDNGTGIPQNIPRTRGLGLQIMRHRAETIGATLEINRGENGGTIVTCRLPV